jgi:glycosyltransferase involved in cell wall biosynthesis
VKVVFVNRFFYPDQSATSQLLSDLAMHLAAAGMEVAVVTSRLRYQDAAPVYAARERVGGVQVLRVLTSRFGRFSLPGRALDYLTFYVAAGWTLLRVVKAGDVLVAKTDPPLISVVAALVAARRGARLVNWVQDLFPEVAAAAGVRRLDGALGRWLRVWRDWSLARAECCVVIGERMARRLSAEAVPRNKLRVIHNWVDGDVIAPMAHADNAWRAGLDLDAALVVGYSGNLGRAHEYETVLGAAEALRARSDIVFLFIGGGVLSRAFQQACEERGLSNVRFLPYQPKTCLRESLGACDVHLIVLRPEMEGLVVPSKFYGVAAAGRPMLFVGDPEGEIAGMIRAAGAGVAVATGDVQGLAGVIIRLASDAEAREAMGRRGREAFDRDYARDVALRQWQAVLQGCAGEGRQSAWAPVSAEAP